MIAYGSNDKGSRSINDSMKFLLTLENLFFEVLRKNPEKALVLNLIRCSDEIIDPTSKTVCNFTIGESKRPGA